MTCPKCNTTMNTETVTETQRRGCVTILIYIILLFIPIIGWIALFKMLGGSHKVHGVTYFVCPNCGHRKRA